MFNTQCSGEIVVQRSAIAHSILGRRVLTEIEERRTLKNNSLMPCWQWVTQSLN